MTTAAVDDKSLELQGLCPDELLCLDRQLCFPLYAASKEVVRAYVPLLRDLDITYTQYIVMMVLWEQGSASVRELGDRLFLDSGTLTPLLKKLEAKGLVSRTADATDGRRVVVELTDEGRALKGKAARVPVAMGSCLGFSPAEAAQLKELLDKVIRNVRGEGVNE